MRVRLKGEDVVYDLWTGKRMVQSFKRMHYWNGRTHKFLLLFAYRIRKRIDYLLG